MQSSLLFPIFRSTSLGKPPASIGRVASVSVVIGECGHIQPERCGSDSSEVQPVANPIQVTKLTYTGQILKLILF